jgi:hypothetical protein
MNDDIVIGHYTPFTFDEQNWRNIVDALGVEVSPEFRFQLELIARHFRSGDEHRARDYAGLARYRTPMSAIAKAGRAIIDELSNDDVDRLACYAMLNSDAGEGSLSGDQIALQWELFKRQVEQLCKFCATFERGPDNKPPHVDLDRDRAWGDLAALYEKITGRGPKFTSSTVNGTVTGRFVRFIQAFMATVPGEKEPTGHQIRAFLRKARGCNGERGKKSTRSLAI